MIPVFNSNSGPFMVLWYLFLVFFALVIAANIVALFLKGILVWRTSRFVRKHATARKAAK